MSEIPERWKSKSSKIIADCRVFKVREDFCERESDNLESTFFVIDNPDWVNIIALNENQEVVMIEQFRHGTQEVILEIPGGMVDEGEEIELAARRELLEETGYSSEEFILLGKSRPNPAIQDNWIYHFGALNAEKTHDTTFDEHESVIAKLVALEKIPNLIATEAITHSLVIAAFYLFDLQNNEK